MRLPNPGPHHRRDLPQLLENAPILLVLVDHFARRIQRHATPAAQWAWYSRKEQAHTIESQSAVVEETAGSATWPPVCPVPPRTARCARPPACANGCGPAGRHADQGLGRLHPEGTIRASNRVR
jgi:hypothetical protein